MLERSMDRATAAVYVGVVRDRARARASSLLYRHFQLRELPALVRGRLDGARLEMPVKVLFGTRDPAQSVSQLPGLDAHAAELDVELVDGSHFLVDERPDLVADRARAWFA
jgi:pimeloyl-ACP methyl ester carboxylesterase